MVDRLVRVETTSRTVHGRLAGHDADTVTVIEPGGEVAVIPKDEVLSLRAEDTEAQSSPRAPQPESHFSRRWEKRAVTLTALGASFSAIGIIGWVIFAVGSKDGREAQQKVEDPTIVGDEYDYWDMRGKRANAVRYTGAIIGSRLIGGIVMLSMGIAWRPRPNKRSRMTRVTPLVSPALAGIGLVHRF